MIVPIDGTIRSVYGLNELLELHLVCLLSRPMIAENSCWTKCTFNVLILISKTPQCHISVAPTTI